MSELSIPQRLLFRLSVPCIYEAREWTAQGLGLNEKHRLPNFAELEGRPPLVEASAAWNETGFGFSIVVKGKKQLPWCRGSKAEDSDCVQLWIDTRDVHDVHRANRFCHRFLFMPSGSGQKLDEPTALWLPINRAKEEPKPVPPRAIKIRGMKTPCGYAIETFLPGNALTGFDPQEYPRLGFTFAVFDREIGEQTFTVGSPLPYRDDPSLWATLELVR